MSRRDCSKYENCLSEKKTIIIDPSVNNMLHLGVVGCWGVYCDDGKYKYTKKKKDKIEDVEVVRGQGRVSRALERYNQQKPISDMFLAGDNVYQEGVPFENKETPIGTFNIERQLERGFENCFLKCGINRFFALVGNHDIENCDILNKQINYPLWNMPSLYYNVVYTLNTNDKLFRVNVIVIDTNMFDVNDKELSDPLHCDKTPYTIGQLFAQKQWVRQVIKDERADWNIIIGHIPYLSNGHKNKNHPVYRIELANFIREVKPDLYICADEHNQQIIKDRPTTIVVCGSGGTALDKIEHPYIENTIYANKEFGFVSLEITNNNLVIRFISSEILFEHTITKL